MKNSVSLPFIISPSLGFPVILSTEAIEPLTVIVASNNPPFGSWSLRPSAANRSALAPTLPLTQIGTATEIPRSSEPHINSTDDTRLTIGEYLRNIVDGDARFFKVTLLLEDTCINAGAMMYDLCLDEAEPKLHAVCLKTSVTKELNFIHLTDLHLSRRNDLIEDEISNVTGPLPGFNNFNENMRRFIKKANAMASNGKLDLVLIGGDLVDFVNHGVSDNGDEPDNNWSVFIEILTGSGDEREKNNFGLTAPVFTTTGNHDWRLHPYDIHDLSAAYNINKKQAKEFDFEYFDTSEKLENKKNEVYNKIIKEGSPISKENLFHVVLKGLLRWSSTWQAKSIVPVIGSLIAYPYFGKIFLSALKILPKEIHSVAVSGIIFLLAVALHWGINKILSYTVRKAVTNAIIPIEASIEALHRYFLHINPYLNYAFSFGSNRFIMMDTGPDCFTGQYLWDEGNKKMKITSVKNSILGGSPDSMAFYPANEYYSYGQITWLEQALNVPGKSVHSNKTDRIFICLHAPPINLKERPETTDKEKLLLKEYWFCGNSIKQNSDIRVGTINHYLSQFFHLCLGRKENHALYKGPKADLVLCGHAHQAIEFRLSSNNDGSISVYTGNYSSQNVLAVFDNIKPVIAQSAACGPAEDAFSNTPYYRVVQVSATGDILQFNQTNPF